MRVGYKRKKPSLDISGCTKLLQVSVFRTAIMNIETRISTCIQVIQHAGMWVIIEIIMFSATLTRAFLKKKKFQPSSDYVHIDNRECNVWQCFNCLYICIR